jgi:hypothetical protein
MFVDSSRTEYSVSSLYPPITGRINWRADRDESAPFLWSQVGVVGPFRDEIDERRCIVGGERLRVFLPLVSTSSGTFLLLY